MKLSVKQLRVFVEQCLTEMGPTGALRRVRGSGGRQYKIGKVEDENRELSFSEAEMMFPGSAHAWADVVPELFPDFPFDDPFSIKKNSTFFKIGQKLTVAFAEAPQIELATWDPSKEDWIENEFSSGTYATG